jgi:hypothetical protein
MNDFQRPDHIEPAFNKVAKSSPKPKRPSPISIRFSDSQKAKLKIQADGQALGPYIKKIVLQELHNSTANAPRMSTTDFEAYARVLSELGRSNLHMSLRTIADRATKGSLDIDDGVIEAIEGACASIVAMRNDLIAFLGLREGKRS